MAWSPTLAPSIESDLVMDEAVAVVGLARLEPGLHAGERLVTSPCFKFGRACPA
jgi:hypothetical protein